MRAYLRSIEIVRDLEAKLLITGHGEPVRDAETIRGDLAKMHAAVSWLESETIARMNAGKDVHTLMREIDYRTNRGSESFMATPAGPCGRSGRERWMDQVRRRDDRTLRSAALFDRS